MKYSFNRNFTRSSFLYFPSLMVATSNDSNVPILIFYSIFASTIYTILQSTGRYRKGTAFVKKIPKKDFFSQILWYRGVSLTSFILSQRFYNLFVSRGQIKTKSLFCNFEDLQVWTHIHQDSESKRWKVITGLHVRCRKIFNMFAAYSRISSHQKTFFRSNNFRKFSNIFHIHPSSLPSVASHFPVTNNLFILSFRNLHTKF